ncbi:proteasome subunit alpha type-6-like isoform X1 [Lycium ferocissimum]|uniref:proteasome subunit alpha type-6-like isoform X1 n=1 Tax=Lycium ferocissimum TaxID=112874 RepID=UPI002814A63B|nr:proteasome subunit alpha type-6-like isoform X1 [Lycium ferocissimum]
MMLFITLSTLVQITSAGSQEGEAMEILRKKRDKFPGFSYEETVQVKGKEVLIFHSPSVPLLRSFFFLFKFVLLVEFQSLGYTLAAVSALQSVLEEDFKTSEIEVGVVRKEDLLFRVLNYRGN